MATNIASLSFPFILIFLFSSVSTSPSEMSFKKVLEFFLNVYQVVVLKSFYTVNEIVVTT